MSSTTTVNIWGNFPEWLYVGVLQVQETRGKTITSFAFSNGFLESKKAFLLDPDLQSYRGLQYPPAQKENFGFLTDSAPDRWGRQLMKRREILLAKQEQRQPRTLSEIDYLLGVNDLTRMGALRFEIDGEFICADQILPIPPWTSLRELENASLDLEKETLSSVQEEATLKLLLAPGSSLGGARPKASVIDPRGELWIAKFPSRSDDIDVGAWEMVAYKLAQQCKINLPQCELKSFSKIGSTFLSKRFDRIGEQRIHFASAMTLLGLQDGASKNEGVSYLDLAEFITQYCVDVEANLFELWKRIVFNVAISNTDDHLRNHGFLLTEKGWTLSPAYDMNPNPDGVGLSLNILTDDNRLDYDLVRSVAPYFRIKDATVNTIIAETKHALHSWQKIATQLRIPPSSQSHYTSAFHL